MSRQQLHIFVVTVSTVAVIFNLWAAANSSRPLVALLIAATWACVAVYHAMRWRVVRRG